MAAAIPPQSLIYCSLDGCCKALQYLPSTGSQEMKAHHSLRPTVLAHHLHARDKYIVEPPSKGRFGTNLYKFRIFVLYRGEYSVPWREGL